jgi:glycosyltransferase involved in cell wall biosynthesis
LYRLHEQASPPAATFSAEIKSGKLIFYKTTTPQYFNRSHSRNLIYKLATGDIICNVDADNYTDANFASYLNNEFNNNANVFLTPIGSNQKRDVLGRTCVKRSDFFSIGGYDERMANYGFEDFDFINRLELSGLTSKLEAIGHEESERLSNEALLGNLSGFYVSYLTPSSTDSLFIFNDNTFIRGIIIDNASYKPQKLFGTPMSHLGYTHSILEDEWVKGTCKTDANEVILSRHNSYSEKFFFDERENCLVDDWIEPAYRFYKISDPKLIQDAVMFLSQITNRLIMEKNSRNKQVTVNSGHFGNGIVYKNFDDKTSIAI